MSYTVTIRKNATGETRVYDCSDLEWREHSLFWWTDGNFGCDCNRELSFERAGGSDPDIDAVKCGDGAFTVLHADFPDGSRIIIDPPTETPSQSNGSES